MGTLRFFAIVILIYIIFRLMIRYLLPYLVRKFVEQQKERFYQANPHVRREEGNPKKNGEIQINQSSKPKKINPDGVGEYVDFEELD